jgi:hypothetical protein
MRCMYNVHVYHNNDYMDACHVVYYTIYNVPRCHTPYMTARGRPAIDAKKSFSNTYCVLYRTKEI